MEFSSIIPRKLWQLAGPSMASQSNSVSLGVTHTVRSIGHSALRIVPEADLPALQDETDAKQISW